MNRMDGNELLGQTADEGIRSSTVNPRWYVWAKRIFFGVLLLGAAGMLFNRVLVPAFQPPVDPDLEDIEIRHTGKSDPGSEIRGSTTDLLFDKSIAGSATHPLDPALAVARKGLERIRAEVRDYTALMIKQERVNGTLRPEETVRVKVRHRREQDGQVIPKSFYLYFEKPASVTGREVIWVEGRNDDHLTAHEGGIKNLFSVNLAPDSFLAMAGNRYPITELGIETLMVRMIEKGERDRKHGECSVSINREIEVDGQKCTLITITHPEKRDHFEFHQAKIYVNDEIDLPIGYEGFEWPEQPGGEPVLIERYFYRELKVNVGLKDIDFDPENPEYRFR